MHFKGSQKITATTEHHFYVTLQVLIKGKHYTTFYDLDFKNNHCCFLLPILPHGNWAPCFPEG